jgi:pimeloyl-ACP methyl ester carboxylesterase
MLAHIRKSPFAVAAAIFVSSFAASSASANSVSKDSGKSCSIADAGVRDGAKADGKRFSVMIEGPDAKDVHDIILIPGLSTPRDVWDRTVTGLAGCYRIHTVQIRGFGDDAGINAEGPLLEPFVKELADYIDDEITGKGRGKPVIVGHSLGGLSAIMIGARHPDLPSGIFVVDALPFIGTLFNPAATVETVRPQAVAMAAMMRGSYGKAQPEPKDADPGANSMAGFYSNSGAGRTAVARWTRTSDPRVTAQALYDDMTTDMRSELPTIKAPLGLLYAQDDSAVTPEAAEKTFVPQYAGTPVFDARMVSGSRHFIMLDQPEKFAEELESFLTTIFSSGPLKPLP